MHADHKADISQNASLTVYPYQVKILYVRNLMVSTTEESLREHFIRVAGGDANCVERVKKINDYAFIHFKEREQAAKCLQALNGKQK